MSSARQVVVVSGNPRPGSRTSTIATRLAAELGTPQVIELGELAPEFFAADSVAIDAARKSVAEADVLVVATPSYKGSFTGLLKVFLDGFGTGALAGRDVHPVVLAASPAHVGSTTEHLQVVLSELGLQVVPGLALTEEDLVRVDALIAEVAADER
ncbi:NADPH-dependent FMN reductase [Naumannella halotolerans]|uniref:FMN reductase n=1 Tax=Naumannella halotolerans TaxID=993414 RepID=A0A4R7J9L1_9ACTN|nr:NAD(P)H-dependent oxidoreductase [Naumannella halotolerans]TDT33287.1 FMN reductase [Naumannella halotolerans]